MGRVPAAGAGDPAASGRRRARYRAHVGDHDAEHYGSQEVPTTEEAEERLLVPAARQPGKSGSRNVRRCGRSRLRRLGHRRDAQPVQSLGGRSGRSSRSCAASSSTSSRSNRHELARFDLPGHVGYRLLPASHTGAALLRRPRAGDRPAGAGGESRSARRLVPAALWSECGGAGADGRLPARHVRLAADAGTFHLARAERCANPCCRDKRGRV